MKYELFLETDDPEQKFKYYKCTTNNIGVIMAATVGGVCALSIIIGAIGLYLFDRYLKKKEVRDHEKEGMFQNYLEIKSKKTAFSLIWRS